MALSEKSATFGDHALRIGTGIGDLRHGEMAAYLEERTSKSAVWCRRLASFSAVLFIVSGLAHRYGLLETVAFLVVLGLVALLAALALLLAAFAFPGVWSNGDRGGRDLTFGTVVALLVLVPFLLSGYRAFKYPELNDISTDLDDPPALTIAERTRTPGMNPLTEPTPAQRKLQMEKYPDVTGRRYNLPLDSTLNAVESVLSRTDWKLYGPMHPNGDEAEVSIEALAYTTLLAFPIDVSIRLIDEGETTYVDVRSASRYGRHDLGDNAARIDSFLKELDAEVATQLGEAPADSE
jgi:uncharacterized protein (DUF1499 family)